MHIPNLSHDHSRADDYALGGCLDEKMCLQSHQGTRRSPLTEEFRRIQEHYPILSSTSCSSGFCQSGRAIHTEEPRLGRDQPLQQIEAEAVDFLRQMRRENLFVTDADYQNRLREVLREIRENAAEPQLLAENANLKPTDPVLFGELSSSGWIQRTEELEFGIRIAWKHSRKCIMRSQYKDLRLCDLRYVKTSVEMGQALVQSLKKAFGHGMIQPTVFVFPPRQVGKSGPMIWNQQLVSFAGYINDDESILGDPKNVSLTTSIIELGWSPPRFRTKWDLLPLVTMAEDDEPVITDISSEDFPLVHIRHPRHQLPFEKLGLRWIPAPVLSRLGFDIGGVQYTASPFIGWFMDAEIGVRDLVDKARYDVLPHVVQALYPNELHRPLEQLPEHERLCLLGRAQTELNYAVYHSFSQSRVRMSDALTASSNYCRFDDEHLEKYGFRLPADPYWLAPPQGSIVPLWHRGGAPHYQPKPMICRHREDPVKAWKRRQKCSNCASSSQRDKDRKESVVGNGANPTKARHRLLLHYCTTGGMAAKLANAVFNTLQERCRRGQNIQVVLPPQPFDLLNLSDLLPTDTIIIVASSTGRGNVPVNGRRTVECLDDSHFKSSRLPEARFSVFGNGDSSYADTFNDAARTIHDLLKKRGLLPLNDYEEGDNARESPPWEPLHTWLKHLSEIVFNETPIPNSLHIRHTDEAPRKEDWNRLIGSFDRFKVGGYRQKSRNLEKVTLYSSDISYSVMDYVEVLPPNEPQKVKHILQMLRKKSNNKMALSGAISYFDVLTEFVELEQPFRNLDWAAGLLNDRLDSKTLASVPVAEALQLLPSGWQRKVDLDNVLVSMSPITPRTFSIASIPSAVKRKSGGQRVELMVQRKHGGKFSEQFLGNAKVGSHLRCRIRPAIRLRKLCDKTIGPMVAFVTGSGFAPMQSLLQYRARHHRDAEQRGERSPFEGQISLFLGFRSEDACVIHEGVHEAARLRLLDMLFLTPSNASKVRAQDKVFQPGIREHVDTKIKRGAWVFVCANPAAADDIAVNLSAILGCDVRRALGEKYVEDRFGPA
ncbi:MAG: hypothetical protein Q9160_007707 [Pyrenula sp. 1 TL-2023]